MRIAGTALLTALLCLPTLAYAGNGVNFGHAHCRGVVTCQTQPSALPSIVANAQACSDMFFGPRGYTFSQTQLDSRNCLQSVPTSSTKGKGQGAMTMIPHCCVIQSSDSCHVECDLWGVD